MPKIQPYAELLQQDTGIGCQKALVITGDKDLRSRLKYALDSYGIQVLFRQAGAEALAFSMIDPFDCLILDGDARGIDGIDLIRRLRKRFEYAVIIGLCKEERGVEYLEAGANDFLKKPFVPYRLSMMLDGGDLRG